MPSLIPPTKSEVRWRAAGYAAVGLVGVAVVLANPADGIRGTLGFWSALVWSGFMLSSFGAALATLRGNYRVEYVLLPLFGIALLVAVLAGWTGFWVDQPLDWQRAARAISATALLCFLVARYVNLRRIVRAVKRHEPWTTL